MNVFEKIYATNEWQAGSGNGSLASLTESYRHFIEMFLVENQIRSVLDFGCGDWQFSRLIDWGVAEYTGVDVVPSLIASNASRFARANVNFRLLEPGASDLPKADLLICKDVIQHFSNDEVTAFLRDVVPNYKYALITNCAHPVADQNRAIETGRFRPLDVRNPPFDVRATCVFRFEWGGGAPQGHYAIPAWKKLVLLVNNKL